ncbi:MAG: polysaccharide biosynthesis tyrosine autokinase [Deltaproteobacteria bacterium]|nr:polysaccharide biosynthesis tyrosine autokinase [Deltaproteobacteria bacterium]
MDRNVPSPLVVSASPVASKTPGFDYEADLQQQHSLRAYWTILKKRKWCVLGVLFAVVGLVGFFTFLQTPIYRSSTTLQIMQDNTSSMVSERDPMNMMAWYTSDRFYETQFSVLKSRPLAYSIIEALNLKDHPYFQGFGGKSKQPSPQELRSDMADIFLANLEVRPYKRSYLVEIAFRSPDKYLAQQVPNAIYNEYVNFSMKTRHHSYKLIKEWLEREIQVLASKVEASERKLYEHGQRKDFLSLEGDQNVIVKKYVELSKLLTTAQAERAAKEAMFRQVKEKGADAPLVVNNMLVQRLREETIAQEAKVSSMSKIYDVNYPQLQVEKAKLAELRGRLGGEVRRLATSIQSDYEAAVRAENLLKESLEAQKEQVKDLQHNLVQHHNLLRDLTTNEQLYKGLLARMKEASIASTMVSGNVAVISPAELPLQPYSPNKALNLSLATLIGLLGGIGLALLREHLDDSIKSAEELERTCRIPSLGMVPSLAGDIKGLPELRPQEVPLAVFKEPRSIISEAIYHVRTSILLSLSGGPPAVIMVTSANPNEGKTTITSNLAASLAMNDRKVVILDCDLRKPSLHPVFQQPLAPGLSSLLTGNAVKEEVIRTTPVPNLFFIPAGPVPPNPVALLTSQEFMDFLKELRQEFQNIIVDTPPVIGFAEGRALSSQVDGVILVVRHNATSRDSGRLAMQLLSQVNAQILGGIFNMADSSRMGYGAYLGHYKHYARSHQESGESRQLR